MAAPETTAPLESVTRPRIVPRNSCAKADTPSSITANILTCIELTSLMLLCEDRGTLRHGRSIAARVRTSVVDAVRVAHHSLAASHGIRKRRADLDLMPALDELLARLRRDARLHA